MIRTALRPTLSAPAAVLISMFAISPAPAQPETSHKQEIKQEKGSRWARQQDVAEINAKATIQAAKEASE
jgi:hypothetical protein